VRHYSTLYLLQYTRSVTGGYSAHHDNSSYYPSHGYPESSFWAGTSASARYPNWYFPLQMYASYRVHQVEHAVEVIRQFERRMDDFAHVQTEMQASIDSQTSMMHDLFSH
jgi:hypothetical protein